MEILFKTISREGPGEGMPSGVLYLFHSHLSPVISAMTSLRSGKLWLVKQN